MLGIGKVNVYADSKDSPTVKIRVEYVNDKEQRKVVAQGNGVLIGTDKGCNAVVTPLDLVTLTKKEKKKNKIPAKAKIEIIVRLDSQSVEEVASVEATNKSLNFAILKLGGNLYANHIVFDFEKTTVVSRLIEGEYFKIDQMLSSDYETKVKINKKELLDCIDRSTLLVKEGDKKPIIINIAEGTMELKINSFIGSMNEEIDIEKDGKDILIGFNPKFFIDALRVIDDEEISLYMVNPKAPCFIKDDAGKFIYLILPVNFNNASN